MSGCGCKTVNELGAGGGPFSKGKELVEFVYNAHDGAVRDQPISTGPLEVICQGCDTSFTLATYVGICPHCGGVHAVAPMNPTVDNVQFAGKGFALP
jgi:hypothetical protein